MGSKMGKKKISTIFSIIYGIIMTIIFTVFLLVATSKGADKTSILANRFFISIFFIVFGGSFIKFREKISQFFYARKDIATFKDEEGKQKAISQVKYMGTCVFIVGISLLSLALFLFFTP